MVRSRYWKLTSDEVGKFSFDSDKVLNWDIKCIRAPDEDARFFTVFLFRSGTPLGYDSVKGIVYNYNNLDREELPNITKFLKEKFGGKVEEKGERIFLKDSDEIYSGKDISELAKELESKFNTKATITIEFQDLTEEERKQAGLPDAKLLPIPGK